MIKITIDDWLPHHQALAAEEGWCIGETGIKNTPNHLEIQRIDDVEQVSMVMGVNAIGLPGDDQAVEALRQSWLLKNDHALLAYRIIRYNSPAEFCFWGMSSWTRSTEKNG